MKFKLFSVVVGTEACVASCPFCVSGEAPCKQNMSLQPTNWRNFAIGANLACRSGVNTVMLTSRGEPTLFPEQITDFLTNLKPFSFPFIELQTNGIPFAQKKEFYKPFLQEWYRLGLTHICLSVASYKPTINQSIYLPKAQSYIDLVALINYLHEIGFSVRLTCVCCKGLMDTVQEMQNLISFAKQNKVEQLTLRPVNDEYRKQSAADWIAEHRLSDQTKEELRVWLETNGTRLLNLEGIGCVYDVSGQNVMFSVPLTKYTRQQDPENARQLIFFPDGHLRYEWEMEGGILL